MSILICMVRTSTFDRSVALSRAMETFSSKGYAETSMDDLVKATGVSRYGIYGTFGNKRELFEQSLEKYADNMGRMSFLRLLEPDASLEHIRHIFAERIEGMCDGSDRRGCLICQTAMELAPHDHEIAEVLQKFMNRMSKAFAIGLGTAKEHGEVRENLDPEQGGQFLTGVLFGMTVLARAGYSREALNHYVDSTLASLAP